MEKLWNFRFGGKKVGAFFEKNFGKNTSGHQNVVLMFVASVISLH